MQGELFGFLHILVGLYFVVNTLCKGNCLERVHTIQAALCVPTITMTKHTYSLLLSLGTTARLDLPNTQEQLRLLALIFRVNIIADHVPLSRVINRE